MRYLLVVLLCMQCAYATPPTCQEVLDSCNTVVQLKNQELELSRLGIQYRDKTLEMNAKELSEYRSRGTNIFNNPLVWGAIGVIFGAYAGARAVR